MRSYLVSWSIDIDAENPREAAEKALEIHRNRDSLATVFDVLDVQGGGKLTTVDLGEGENSGNV